MSQKYEEERYDNNDIRNKSLIIQLWHNVMRVVSMNLIIVLHNEDIEIGTQWDKQLNESILKESLMSKIKDHYLIQQRKEIEEGQVIRYSIVSPHCINLRHKF